MLPLHPQFLTAPDGQRVAVQLSLAEFEELVLAAFDAGRLSAGEAADQLGLSRPEFYELARRAGLSTCAYTSASVEAEIGSL